MTVFAVYFALFFVLPAVTVWFVAPDVLRSLWGRLCRFLALLCIW